MSALATDVLAEVPRARRLVIGGVVLGLVTTSGQLALMLIAATVLDSLLRGAGVAWRLAWILGGWVLAAAISAMLMEMNARHVSSLLGTWMRARSLNRILELGPGSVSRQRTGELQVLLVEGIASAAGYVARVVPTLLNAVVSPLLVIVVFFFLDWPTALGLTLLVFALPLMTAAWLAWRMPKSGFIFEELGLFNAQLLDGIQGLSSLKANNASARWRSKLSYAAAALRRRSMDTLRVTLMRDGVSAVISLGGICGLAMVNAWRLERGTTSMFVVLATLFAAREAIKPIQQLESAFHAGHAGASSLGALRELWASPPIAPSPPAEEEMDAGAGDEAQTNAVTFEDVTFAYPGQERPSIREVSLRLGVGETVALVGASGAGKSTLAALLQRFYEPQHGSIAIDGRDIRKLSRARLAREISVVSQETYLFPGTIADNIRLGSPDASNEELVRVAKAAFAHDFIDALPDGYDTQVGERGNLLSGGQKQRIAIARALLTDTHLLILDEPTANLDAASEHEVLVALVEVLKQNRTTLLISHSPTLMRYAHRIVVLDEGRVIEEGSHAALMDLGGTYARLLQGDG